MYLLDGGQQLPSNMIYLGKISCFFFCKAVKVLTIHQEPQRYSFFLPLPSEINDGSKLQRANSEAADKRKAETDKKSSSAIFKKTRQWKVEECQSFVAED